MLESFVLKGASGLEGRTYYREVSPGNHSYCQVSGGGVVYPQDFTTDGLAWLGDMTIGVAKLEQWAAAAIADEALEPLGGFVAVNMFVKSNPLFFEIAGIAVTDNQVFFGAAGSMAWWSVMVSLLMNIISP